MKPSPHKAKKLTPKQKKLVALLPAVATGDMTMEAALLKAGYSKSSARQQSDAIGNLRQNSVMQNALRDNGIDEKTVASKIKKGLDTFDKDTMFKFTKLAAELLDAFPATKNINAEVGIDELIKGQEASTPAEK